MDVGIQEWVSRWRDGGMQEGGIDDWPDGGRGGGIDAMVLRITTIFSTTPAVCSPKLCSDPTY